MDTQTEKNKKLLIYNKKCNIEFKIKDEDKLFDKSKLLILYNLDIIIHKNFLLKITENNINKNYLNNELEFYYSNTHDHILIYANNNKKDKIIKDDIKLDYKYINNNKYAYKFRLSSNAIKQPKYNKICIYMKIINTREKLIKKIKDIEINIYEYNSNILIIKDFMLNLIGEIQEPILQRNDIEEIKQNKKDIEDLYKELESSLTKFNIIMNRLNAQGEGLTVKLIKNKTNIIVKQFIPAKEKTLFK